MVSASSGLTVEVAHNFDSALGGEGPSGASLTREEWDELLARSASNIVFMTWQWQSVWWRHFGAQEECRLHLLVVRDEKGALTGVAPLFITSEPLPPPKAYKQGALRPKGEGAPLRIVRIVGGIDVADYLDVIAPHNRMENVWSVVLDYLVEQRVEWDVIDFHSLPQFSPSHQILPRLAAERGLDFRVFPEDVSPVISLPDDWEAYLMSLRKKDRHELRRKVRKLEGRDDVKWYLVTPTDAGALHIAMETFLDLHRKSDTEKAGFMDDKMANYFLDMAASLAATGWLDLAILEVDNQPASAYLSFVFNGRVYLYNSGYDPRFASYSAGVALLAYRIHKAILQGCRYFDFLRGDESYKYDFGAKSQYVYRALCQAEKQA